MADAMQNGTTGSPKEAHSEDLKAAQEYWTEERRNAAKPYPMPEGTAPKEAEMAEPPKGEPGMTPHGHGSETHGAAHDEGRMGAAFGVPNPLAYPFRTVGKIYFNQAGGGYSASAAMVSPNVLLTAGHCVFGSRQWSTNMVFYPSFGSRAASDPLNHVACGRLSCRTSWVNNGDRPHDYAMVWMPSTPGNVIGWQGLLWNASNTGRVWTAVGYPATPNPPFNGNTMQEAVGTNVNGASGTFGLQGDNMEHGSSGGPWITKWGNDGPPGAHANGLQSFHIHDGDQVEYGPYFTDEVKSLFDWLNTPGNHW